MEEHMPSGVCSINYSTIEYTSLIFFLVGVLFWHFHEISREYVGMFLSACGIRKRLPDKVNW